MGEVIKTIFSTPLPNILIVAGVLVLVVAVVGKIRGWIDPGGWGRIGGAVLGAILCGIGFYQNARHVSDVDKHNQELKVQLNQTQSQLQVTSPKPQALPAGVVPVEGDYEWQWAGAGWKGNITVEKNGEAQIQMFRHFYCGGGEKVLTLLQQAGNAHVEPLNHSTQLKITIPIKFINYDKDCNNTGLAETTVLKGILNRKIAYAGTIRYETGQGAPSGDMVLVKGYSSGVKY